MGSRWFKHMLIALAVLAAQWAGLAHSIEHREHLEAGHVHSQSDNDLLHSCLLFDGLTTAQAPVSTPPASPPLPLLAQLGTRATVLVSPRNSLFAQRVRVRDPPRIS